MAENEIIMKPVHFGECFIPENISLSDFMMAEMENFSGKVAMIHAVTGQQKTYGKLIEEIHQLTEGLYLEGFKHNEVFAISSTNCSEYFTVTLAGLRLGAILTTANPSYAKEELVHQFRAVNARYVFSQPDKWDLMQEVKQEVPSIKAIYLLSSDSGHPGTLNYEDLLNRGRQKCSKINFPKIDPRTETAAILFSSGTTGLPKGVMITHRNLVANICQSSIGVLFILAFGSGNSVMKFKHVGPLLMLRSAGISTDDDVVDVFQKLFR